MIKTSGKYDRRLIAIVVLLLAYTFPAAALAARTDRPHYGHITTVNTRRHTVVINGVPYKVSNSCVYLGKMLRGFSDLKRGLYVEFRIQPITGENHVQTIVSIKWLPS